RDVGTHATRAPERPRRQCQGIVEEGESQIDLGAERAKALRTVRAHAEDDRLPELLAPPIERGQPADGLLVVERAEEEEHDGVLAAEVGEPHPAPVVRRERQERRVLADLDGSPTDQLADHGPTPSTMYTEPSPPDA